jgi:hypothetical protein
VIEVTYHDDLKEVQGDGTLAALLDSPAQAAPFDRLAFWQGLTAHCGIEPLLAVASDGAQRGVLPLAKDGDGLKALGNWYSFRTRPLASDGADAEALWAAIARDLARRTRRVTLSALPDEGGEAQALARAFRRAGWLVEVSACDTNHILDVGTRSFAEYLAARPGPLRTTLKRKAKKVEVTLLRAFDAAAWDDYETIYRQSWKPSEGSPAFLRAFAEAEGAAGRLRFALAHAEIDAEDGQKRRLPVAAQFWTVEGGTAFIHKLAHVEAAKPLSAGTTLSAALFEEVIDRDRVSLVDFGTGDDGYKRDWMERQRVRYRIEALRPWHPANWPKALKILRRRLARATPTG